MAIRKLDKYNAIRKFQKSVLITGLKFKQDPHQLGGKEPQPAVSPCSSPGLLPACPQDPEATVPWPMRCPHFQSLCCPLKED